MLPSEASGFLVPSVCSLPSLLCVCVWVWGDARDLPSASSNQRGAETGQDNCPTSYLNLKYGEQLWNPHSCFLKSQTPQWGPTCLVGTTDSFQAIIVLIAAFICTSYSNTHRVPSLSQLRFHVYMHLAAARVSSHGVILSAAMNLTYSPNHQVLLNVYFCVCNHPEMVSYLLS